MNNNVITSLKEVFNPKAIYNGEWNLNSNLKDISLIKRNKNQFEEFIERYYYIPLNVIFKDEDLVRSFKYTICSKLKNGKRSLYFSKKEFLRNIISNIDEVVKCTKEDSFKILKKYIRDKKDIYREVEKLNEASNYYKEVKKEYLSCNLEITFEQFVKICKKKYTRLLSGYNAVMDFFDKPINLGRFIGCFQQDQLYLFACTSILDSAYKKFDEYGKIDYSLITINKYEKFVLEERKKDKFYNSYILKKENDQTVIYTVDELLKKYNVFLSKVNN